MAHPIENDALPIESSVPTVTGRKAARSLKLFRGDGVNLDALMDTEDQNSEGADISPYEQTAPKHTSEENGADSLPFKPLLEPVSSATYIPHTPLKDNSKGRVEADLPQDNEHDTDHLQHLMADMEFDRDPLGGLTKIQKHSRDNYELQLKHSIPAQSEQNTSSQNGGENETSPSTDAFPLTVELRPFKNKVGGHTAIFRFSEKAVCKALMNRENLWYEAVEKKHLGLWKFMPKYIGVLNVRYSSIVREEEFTPQLAPVSPPSEHDQADGDISEIAELEEHAESRRKSTQEYKPRPLKRGISFHSSAKPASDDLPPEVSLDDNRHMIPDLLWKQLSNSVPSTSSFDDSPYSPELYPTTSPELNDNQTFSIGSTSVNRDLQAQVIQEVFVPQSRKSEEVFSMDDDDVAEPAPVHTMPKNTQTGDLVNPVLRKHTRFERYILLEDLTADMQKPCALDLKMGTRQYGVEATDSKQASQRKKCASTTSRELGVRVCGLQAWNKVTKSYYMRDKYFGRKLKKGKQFAKTLAKFLFDGASALSIEEKIPSIIAQLEELYLSFQDLAGYRMYGSSILLMYDGAASLQDMKIKVHIIDFAQSAIGDDTSQGDHRKPPAHPSLPDRGYLKGLRSLIYYFKQIYGIVKGQSYDERTNGNSNPARLCKEDYWASVFEDDTSNGLASDPFDIDYHTESDEEGVSD